MGVRRVVAVIAALLVCAAAQALAASSRAGFVALAVTSDGRGYWTVTAGGRVRAYGDAPRYGSADSRSRAAVVGIAAAPDDSGYWLVTDRGTVLAFGRARSYGSARPRPGERIVAIAAAPDGRGYWIVAADGRVRRFGDARLFGSHPRGLRDVVAIAIARGGRGYWLASAKGGVLRFGDARYYGSALGRRVVGIAATRDGRGYWVVTSAGTVLAFGDARVGTPPSNPSALGAVVGIAASPAGGYWVLHSGQESNALPAPAPGFIPDHVTAIGDSVMLDVAPDLEADIPGIDVQAAVSRQWDAGIALAAALRSAHQLGAIVVIDLGTNGPITAQQFASMMSVLDGASRVLFVTVHLPPSYSWSSSVNATLSAGVARYPRARLVDFNALADQHPEWFGSDGVHMPIGGPGAAAMALLIKSAI